MIRARRWWQVERSLVPCLHGAALLLDDLTICIERMVDGIDAEWVDQHRAEREQRPKNRVEEKRQTRDTRT